eukprot:g3396.t1
MPTLWKVLLQNGADAYANGADVNAVEYIEYTALHNAAQKGHVYVVKVLIQNSADVIAVQKIKCTAVHSAAQGGHVDIAKVLLENGAD